VPYCGPAPSPSGWLASWNLDPIVLLVAAGLALWSVRRRERGMSWQLAAVACFAILFITPLCTLGSALFSARVGHHLVLTTLLAPLVAAGLELHRRRLPLSLAVLTAVQGLVFWAWHAPPLYAAALGSDAVFWVMQVTITASAALWWAKLRQTPAAGAVAALLATMVQMGLLGALITFADRALYAPHWLTTQSWGLTPLEDQQLAGLIMWAPGSAVYLLAALTILYRSMAPTRVAPA
jgi:putative membrane protein